MSTPRLRIMGKTVGSTHERRESFDVSSPISLTVGLTSGSLSVSVHDEPTIDVILSAYGVNNEWVVEQAEVTFDLATATLTIQSQNQPLLQVSSQHQPRFMAAFMSIPSAQRKSAFVAGSSDVDVLVKIPAQSTIVARTVSGDVDVIGSISSATLETTSGDIRLTGDISELVARSKSGDVTVDSSQWMPQALVATRSGDVRLNASVGVSEVTTSSGDVMVRCAESRAQVASTSGDIDLGIGGWGDFAATSKSGDINVRVRTGLDIDLAANSRSGEIVNKIPLGDDGDGNESTQWSSIRLSSTSGDIRINRAVSGH